jgi:hypothetical protein
MEKPVPAQREDSGHSIRRRDGRGRAANLLRPVLMQGWAAHSMMSSGRRPVRTGTQTAVSASSPPPVQHHGRAGVASGGQGHDARRLVETPADGGLEPVPAARPTAPRKATPRRCRKGRTNPRGLLAS